jgi:two-component sensor histidine kinase
VNRLLLFTFFGLFLGNAFAFKGSNIQKGDSCIQVAQYDKAVQYYSLGIKENGRASVEEQIDLYLKLAHAYKLAERYDRCYQVFDKLRRLKAQTRSLDHQLRITTQYAEYLRSIGRNLNGIQELETIDINAIEGKVDKRSLINYYNRFSALLHQHGPDQERAKEYSNLALKLSREIRDDHLIATSLNELGSIEEHTQDVRKAIPLYLEAYSKWRKQGMDRYAVNPLTNLSRVYLKLSDPDSALFYANKGITLVGDRDWKGVLAQLYNMKLTALEAMGDLEGSLEAMKEYHRLVTQINEMEYSKNLADISAKLELRSKELELEEERLKMKEAESIISNDQLYQRILITIVLSLIIGLTIIVLFLRHFRKTNKELSDLIHTKEVLLKEVHHRVKNNMQVVSSLMDLQSNYAKDDSSREAILNSKDRINSLALAHQYLYLDDKYDSINIDVYLRGIIRSVCDPAIDVRSTFANEQLDFEKAQALGFVLNELLTNSMKHAWDETIGEKWISIKLLNENGTWFFYYADNGKGLSNKTSFLESPTFGVTLIRSFLRRNLKGKLEFGEKPGMNISFSFK